MQAAVSLKQAGYYYAAFCNAGDYTLFLLSDTETLLTGKQYDEIPGKDKVYQASASLLDQGGKAHMCVQDHRGCGPKTIQNELRFSAVVAARSGTDERSRNKLAFCKQVRDETIASHPLLTDSKAHECDATKMHIVQKAGICNHPYVNTLVGSSSVYKFCL